MKKFIIFILLTIMLSSCSCNYTDKDNLNNHKGAVVASRAYNRYDCSCFLYLKEKDNANLILVKVSSGEYDYYQKGDTIK